jgi:hypothetical protein
VETNMARRKNTAPESAKNVLEISDPGRISTGHDSISASEHASLDKVI